MRMLEIVSHCRGGVLVRPDCGRSRDRDEIVAISEKAELRAENTAAGSVPKGAILAVKRVRDNELGDLVRSHRNHQRLDQTLRRDSLHAGARFL